MMSTQDPIQYLREVLSLPPGSREPSPPPPPNSRVGGNPNIPMRKGSLQARRDSIRILKQHIFPHSHLYAITCEDETGHAWDGLCLLEQDEQGFWHGGLVAAFVTEITQKPTREAPWIRLRGGEGKHFFWAGGYLTEKAPDAYLVRLFGKNGLVLEDTVQDGIFLLQSEQYMELPIQVGIYNHVGEQLGVQSFLDNTPEG